MQKTIILLLGLLGIALASMSHQHEHSLTLAQTEAEQAVVLMRPFFQNPTSLDSAECSREHEDSERPNRNVTECLKWIRENLYDNTTYDVFNWRFKGQVDCWIKYAEEFGFEYFEDFPADPFGNEYWAFTMPNTRHYEHWYNDEGCNQIWRMGRGRTQPDAITFYDIHVHEYNTILSLNRMQMTPWVTHDQMVLQFFGITEQCVEMYVDVVAMGRGLHPGMWRIEYYNSTGLTYINSTDLGIPEAERPWSTPVPALGLQGADVCICRTPHYLQICVLLQCNGCTAGCEYFSAFTSSDTSLAPFAHYGNYTVPCHKGSVFTFNGTFDTDPHFNPTGAALIKALKFEDKCEADVFIFWSGQVISVPGNMTGHIEVLINRIQQVYDAGTTGLLPVLEYYDDDGVQVQLTYTDIIAVSPWDSPAFGNDQLRFWVYSKYGRMDVCAGNCEMFPTTLCPIALRLGITDMYTGIDDIIQNAGAQDDPALDAQAGNDIVNTGLGNDVIMGGPGDDILSDHDGHDQLHGNAGNDILISRHGGDILYGGYGYNTYADCANSPGLFDILSNTCADYVLATCATANAPDLVPPFISEEDCCVCGGGTLDGAATAVAAMDVTECNKYVIYPTHEKDHHFDWTPTNLAVGPLLFTCTKIFGMTLGDEIEFRLDDPDFEDYKYTDLDDNCALSVDGWEINWYLGPAVYPPTDDGVQPFTLGESVLDIWFSRKTGMAHICLNPQPQHYLTKCAGGPDGEVSNDYCLAYWIECKDKDPWPDLLLEDYDNTLDMLNWYGYW